MSPDAQERDPSPEGPSAAPATITSTPPATTDVAPVETPNATQDALPETQVNAPELAPETPAEQTVAKGEPDLPASDTPPRGEENGALAQSGDYREDGQPPASHDLAVSAAPVGTRWGDAISAERAAQLAALQRAWEREQPSRPAPFAGVALNGADVFALALSALARGGDPNALAADLRATRHDVGLRASFDLAGLQLDGADLEDADLEGAALRGARLSGANLRRANLRRANLQDADLDRADLSDALLRVANLEGASLRATHLRQANLGGATLARANLRRADLERAVLVLANLEQANLRGAHLASTNLAEARLDGAFLAEAVLQGANLHKARLVGANLTRAHLEGANLRLAVCDTATQLDEAFFNRAALAHLTFGGANLTLVYWGEVQRLGDEVEARRPRTLNVVYRESDWRAEEAGRRKVAWMKSGEFTDAARAYRALAVALRAQGLSKDATRFHYRSELMARHALFYDVVARLFSVRFYTVPWVAARWVVSLLLDVFVGYGDYIGRLLGTYLLLVLGFAGAYLAQWHLALSLPHALDALALSVTAFHGHGLTPPGAVLTHAMLWQTGAESVLGLLIEALFVAAFTRRITGN
ncbi:MAG TPA: pentapeptide repeat-containing protein [Ktedonobacterales bacterium]|nr:pentapeptide repeat-containing protein [Ktedonobacterales bacterium]